MHIKKYSTHIYTALCSLLCLFLLTACEPKAGSSDVVTDTSAETSVQILNTEPEGALAVQQARLKLKPGDTAAVYGQIGGVMEPFFDGYAGFVLADTDVVFCDELGDDDHCDTPWDACCEETDKLKASRASVQIVDREGVPYEFDLDGEYGLDRLTEVVVQGTIASTSTPDNLIINATGLYLRSNTNTDSN